jgi:hypothetical protein
MLSLRWLAKQKTVAKEPGMFEREVRLNGLMNWYLSNLIKDCDETELTKPITAGGNPPAWILAHLALANDYALRLMGDGRIAPAEWHKRFGRGMSPQNDPNPLPSKAELVEALEKGRQQIPIAAAKADPARLNEPHTVDIFKDSPVQTVGDVVAHLLTTHLASHVGQLSTWRRMQGRPPLF